MTKLLPNLRDYDQERASFSWEAARRELDGLPGGRGLNIAYEAIGRHVANGYGDQIAIIWLGKKGERQELTYAALDSRSNRFANVLMTLGVEPGERVYSLAGRIPELYAMRARDPQAPGDLLSVVSLRLVPSRSPSGSSWGRRACSSRPSDSTSGESLRFAIGFPRSSTSSFFLIQRVPGVPRERSTGPMRWPKLLRSTRSPTPIPRPRRCCTLPAAPQVRRRGRTTFTKRCLRTT